MTTQTSVPAELERRAIAFCQAARVASYPDEHLASSAQQLAQACAGEGTLQGACRLQKALQGRALDELRSEYLAIFEHGQDRCPIHETEYGRMRSVAKGNDLADISGFYRAFGVELSETEQREMPDHLSVELEFYGVLLAKQAHLLEEGNAEGVEIVEDARRKFLFAHLGSLARAIASQPALGQSEIYREVFGLCEALVAKECAGLGVTPAPLDGFEARADCADMCCGADDAFNKPGPAGVD